MGLRIFAAKLDTIELNHGSVPYIIGILSLVSLHVRQDSKLHELRVSHIIKSEQVGTGLLQGRAVFSESIRGCPREKLAGTVSKALMKVSVHLIRDGQVFLRRSDFPL